MRAILVVLVLLWCAGCVHNTTRPADPGIKTVIDSGCRIIKYHHDDKYGVTDVECKNLDL